MFSCLRADPEADAQKEQLLRKMQEGYPVTQTPWIPSIMSQAVKSRTFEYGAGQPMLKLTLASPWCPSVKKSSLRMIRKKLLTYYRRFPTLRQGVSAPLPRNTIAVSFATMNFKVGEGCNEFIPFEEFGTLENSYFTYERLSENLQATYYHENGIEYLAGLCYFPAARGMPNISESESEAIYIAHQKADYFPLEPRFDLFGYKKFKRYGRYCETAKKRVVVSFDNPDFYTDCKECEEDAKKYKYVEPKRVKEPKNASSSQEAITTTEGDKPQPVHAEKVNGKFPVLSLLETAGIGLAELNLLNSVPMNSKIPMIHETTMEQLPESEQPKLQDLLQFVIINSEWKIDKDFVSELHIPVAKVGFPVDVVSVFRKEVEVVQHPSESPKVSDLSTWLDANPDFNVHSSSALIARVVLEAGYGHRIGGYSEDVVNSAKLPIEVSSEAVKVSEDPLTPSYSSQDEKKSEQSENSEGSTPSGEDSEMEHVEENGSSSEEDFELID